MVADALIVVSYLSIPAVLMLLTMRRPDLVPRDAAWLFSAFIIACGASHAMGVWTMWVPDYGAQALVKAATAALSLVTAVALWPMAPRVLATPSIASYEAKTAALEREMALARERDAQIVALNGELSEALEAERRLSSLQRQFVSMVSHEFRTPLAVIDGRARQIGRCAGREGRDVDEARAREIAGAVKRLVDLMESVLHSARMEEGAIAFSPCATDLAQIVDEECRAVAGLRPQRRLVIDAASAAPLVGDPVLIRQIVSNLLSNAVKYSDDGSTVTVTVRAEGDEAVVSVADEGVGIPQDEIDRLFTRFFRASTSAGRPGSGIGLNLLRHFVQMHGGRIEVESAVGVGSTFTVRLPVGGVAAAA